MGGGGGGGTVVGIVVGGAGAVDTTGTEVPGAAVSPRPDSTTATTPAVITATTTQDAISTGTSAGFRFGSCEPVGSDGPPPNAAADGGGVAGAAIRGVGTVAAELESTRRPHAGQN